MSLAAHKGMLWAAVGAVSSWTALPFRPVPPGSQILVKRTASGAWQVDLDLGLDYLRAATNSLAHHVEAELPRRGHPSSENLTLGASPSEGCTRDVDFSRG